MRQDLRPLISHLAFLDDLYLAYKKDPSTIDSSWRLLFENGHAAPTAATSERARTEQASHSAVHSLINAYRCHGHQEATLDPLGLLARTPQPDLDPAAHGLGEADMDQVVSIGTSNSSHKASIRQLIERLRDTYAGSIGLEFMHISAPQKRAWLAEQMETATGRGLLDRDTKLVILKKLASAEVFERFLHHKYVGTKRFSLEGAETLIPLLDHVFEAAGRLGVDEAVIGMAHRGRLNVLVHTMGKKPRDVFSEFDDVDPETTLGSGDVKYHLGFSTDHVTRGGKTLHLSLAFNPSHLEAVDPVVVGRVRAKQRRRGDRNHEKVLGILVHGDAAFAGQGLVSETLNISGLRGYRTGGTLHVIVNNQIGFTTSPHESRSTTYATCVAKMIECPIFHVNGEDQAAVHLAVLLAMEYRHRFKSDVIIDLLGFRKYGHNEADEPSFTQPLLYKRIAQKESAFQVYAQELIKQGTVTREEVDAVVAAYSAELEKDLADARNAPQRPTIQALRGVWQGFQGGRDSSVPDVDTGVSMELIAQVTERVTALPDGFHPHPKIARLFKQRQAMGRGEIPVDWGMGETLALGTLLWEGVLVRMAGQDSCRGTFSHRHASVVDVESGEEHMPLAHLHPKQGECRIYDSPLSEAACLGFEFGFSLDYPDGLVVWEAQFGDFVNGAQVLLDQFVASSEDKWRRQSGLTLLLPHGYEGQGPEHSSARIERFLELAAEDNIQVVQPTTAAQMFHLLRRQVLRKWRKPLVVLTPKSLLRHPSAMSHVHEMAHGRFQRVLVEEESALGFPRDQVRRVFLCSGKVCYELAEERKKRGDKKSAIVRLEQLYPWNDEIVANALASYPKHVEIVWVQEEPANLGAFHFVERQLRRLIEKRSFRMVSRLESASPATGSSKAHAIEQRKLLDEAMGKE
ncbi:MAG: 2-oxoglutarate dehydrogenase E1 component [Deltaproteobacteria bacterium]|nr:2-oxoglutarate dehydrogenase E1 component [Deltaproteobacteria bacterium]